MKESHHLTEKQKKFFAGTGIGLFLLLSALVFYFAGKPLIAFVEEPERFRHWVEQRGLVANILFIGMVTLQVIVAVIPGEPLEIAAGYAFGAFEGTLLCVIGILLGSVLVFSLVRRFGVRAIEVFFPLDRIRSLRFLQNEKKLNFWIFLIYFIPGTPKDIMCYFVGLTKMPLRTWILISAFARLPSILTSTVGGNALGTEQYLQAGIVFALTVLISLLGLLAYKRICRIRDKHRK